jgi:hypothetical protein
MIFTVLYCLCLAVEAASLNVLRYILRNSKSCCMKLVTIFKVKEPMETTCSVKWDDGAELRRVEMEAVVTRFKVLCRNLCGRIVNDYEISENSRCCDSKRNVQNTDQLLYLKVNDRKFCCLCLMMRMWIKLKKTNFFLEYLCLGPLVCLWGPGYRRRIRLHYHTRKQSNFRYESDTFQQQ